MAISDEILLKVLKPARYIGGEINMVKKDLAEVDTRFLFCFPDVYEVGMSNLGLSILYYLLNNEERIYCERAFAPWQDMEEEMRKNNQALFSLETHTNAKEFDFIGFTLQYEMSYTNILGMLNLANIGLLSANRTDDDPIICAGGPCAYNPEPLADIVDFFYIGEGEANLLEVMEVYKKVDGRKEEFLEGILKIEGIYVPKFYDVKYKENGEIESFIKNNKNAPDKVKKSIVKNLDKVFYPQKQIVPLIEVTHNRALLEVFRGCIRGCRFCQAGYIYRPHREKTADTLLNQSDCLLATTGHEEISLVSLSTSDYSELEKLADGLLNNGEKLNISLPSLRIDSMTVEILKKIQKVRKSSLTFAPEAGSQRMRDVINKGITEEDFLKGGELVYGAGFSKIKLYFMLGLPTETEEDILGINDLSMSLLEKYYEMPKGERGPAPNLTLSTSCFVPKPFTPFQWERQDTYEEFMDKQRLLKRSLTKKQIKYNYHDAKLSVLEGVFARGDRRVAKVIIRAYELGARFDSWSEYFNYETWEQAFRDVGLSIDFYTSRERSTTEILPWDFIDIGITKEFFIRELEKSKDTKLTPNCKDGCGNCGISICEKAGDSDGR